MVIASNNKTLDLLIWFFVILLAIAGVVANSYYAQVSWSLRAAVGIVVTALGILLILQTYQGKRALVFVKGARAEVRKVVWPSRKETMQTTMVVIAMVLITALFLWALDSFFLWIVSILTAR